MEISRGEQEMWQHIANIDRHLNRIANCLEANEKRQREAPQGVFTLEEAERIVLANVEAVAAVRRGMADMEEAVDRENADRVRRGRD